jgi:thymidylate synthase
MRKYLDLMDEILKNGEPRSDRTGVGTLSLFGYQLRFDLSLGLPIVTTKKIILKSVIHELLWILSGDTNIKALNRHNVNIWNEWANKDGELGPIYGKQWRAWQADDYEIDQVTDVIKSINNHPQSRRHIVSAWNVGDIDYMALPPCHTLYQFYVSNNKKLSCQLYQRSCDIFLGGPFNIASYAILTHIIAQQCNLDVGELILTFGDVHLYKNHISQAKIQMARKPFKLPQLQLNHHPIDDYHFCDFNIVNYKHHPPITAPIAV